jgi:hypothetical protein
MDAKQQLVFASKVTSLSALLPMYSATDVILVRKENHWTPGGQTNE